MDIVRRRYVDIVRAMTSQCRYWNFCNKGVAVVGRDETKEKRYLKGEGLNVTNIIISEQLAPTKLHRKNERCKYCISRGGIMGVALPSLLHSNY